jgi:tetratricopeptide (TPR) repeat protein
MATSFAIPSSFLRYDPYQDRTALAMQLFPFLLLLGMGGVTADAAQSGGSSAAQQVQLHEQRAHQLLNEKKPELAIKEFTAVLAADPHNLDAQANLGVLLYFQKNYAAAEPHLRDAIAQQPNLTKIRALLGMCERRLGKTDAALTDLQAVVSQLPDPNIRLEVGLELIEIYTASHELEKAAGVVAILRQGAPTDPRILYAAYRIYTDLAGEATLGLSVAAPDSGQMH